MIIRIDFQLFIKIIAIKIIKIIKIIAIKIKITPQFLTSPLVHIQCRTQDVRNISREALVKNEVQTDNVLSVLVPLLHGAGTEGAHHPVHHALPQNTVLDRTPAAKMRWAIHRLPLRLRPSLCHQEIQHQLKKAR